MGGTMRLGADPVKLHDGHPRPRDLRRGGDLQAPPPSLRGQQHAAPPARGRGAGLRRHLARRAAGRDDRAARPSVLRRLPVPPRVQLAAQPARAAVPRLRRRRGGAGPGAGRGSRRRGVRARGPRRGTGARLERASRDTALGAAIARADCGCSPWNPVPRAAPDEIAPEPIVIDAHRHTYRGTRDRDWMAEIDEQFDTGRSRSRSAARPVLVIRDVHFRGRGAGGVRPADRLDHAFLGDLVTEMHNFSDQSRGARRRERQLIALP